MSIKSQTCGYCLLPNLDCECHKETDKKRPPNSLPNGFITALVQSVKNNVKLNDESKQDQCNKGDSKQRTK